MVGRKEITVAKWWLSLAAALVASSAAASDGGGYNWGWYIFNPLQDKGVSNLQFLIGGIWATLLVSLCAIGLSVVLGAAIAMAGLSLPQVAGMQEEQESK